MIAEVQDLTKYFQTKAGGSVPAVDGIGFSIAAGERVAFIGPNGAGKSTTLKMLTGLLYPSRGRARVAGYVPWQQRRKLAQEIGIVFGQRSQLWPDLPVADSLTLVSKIYDVPAREHQPRVAEITAVLQIGDLVSKPAGSLSLGQRMRCDIAASLLHKPRILFLDEPTIGLDITAKARLRQHLKRLAEADDTTIILTSHDTGDIEEICERVILIDRGRILRDTPLPHLRAEFTRDRQITVVTEQEWPELTIDGVDIVRRDRHHITLAPSDPSGSLSKVVAAAIQHLSVRDLSIENTPLETIIRKLYGDEP